MLHKGAVWECIVNNFSVEMREEVTLSHFIRLGHSFEAVTFQLKAPRPDKSVAPAFWLITERLIAATPAH